MNLKVRIKNPWFWIGLAGVALTAIGVDPSTFTSWPAGWDGILAVLRNPVQLVTGILALLAVFIDPTTAGIKDSARAMTYKAPAKDKEAK